MKVLSYILIILETWVDVAPQVRFFHGSFRPEAVFEVVLI